MSTVRDRRTADVWSRVTRQEKPVVIFLRHDHARHSGPILAAETAALVLYILGVLASNLGQRTSYFNAQMLHSFSCCLQARSERARPMKPFWFPRGSPRGESRASYHENTCSIPGQSTADLWQTKWHLDRFLHQHFGLP